MYLLKTLWENYVFHINSCLCNPLHMNCPLSHIDVDPLRQGLNKNQPTQRLNITVCMHTFIIYLDCQGRSLLHRLKISHQITKGPRRSPWITKSGKVGKKAHLLMLSSMDTAWMATAIAE